MSKGLIVEIKQVAADKGLDNEVIFSAIEAALTSAYKRNYGSVANVTAEVNRGTGEMTVFAEKEVVEDILNPNTEILLDSAKTLEPSAELGDVVMVQSTPANFGRIAAQAAKQVILQRIREAERDTVYENFIHKVGEIITAQVRSVDLVSGAVTVLVDDKHENLLPRDEQIPSENLRRGDYIRLYVVDVHRSSRGPMIRLSRIHRNLLRRLMEQEIPEVRDGTVEIKAISREPGARSKVSVMATVPGVDPVGSCVGMRGLRIQNIVTELAGERIDVVEWNSNLRTYISNALSPAKVQSVILDEDNVIKTAIVIVPDRQLSLAIGKTGQNARLAAKLTGWRIDIKSETEAHEEGLDVLAAEQAQLATSGQDLLSMAEKILRGEDESATREDAFRQAAALLQQQAAENELAEGASGAEWPKDLSMLDDERAQGIDAEEALSAFERAAASLHDEEQQPPVSFDDLVVTEPQPFAFGESLEEDRERDEETIVKTRAGQAELPQDEQTEDESMLPVEELPEVITADMLRQRMAERQSQQAGSSLEDLEVPAELLVSSRTTEEIDADEASAQEHKRTKSRRDSPAAPKKPARRSRTRRLQGRNESYDSYDEDEYPI